MKSQTEGKKDINYCKVCKGTGFDFDGQICSHCEGTGSCKTCIEMLYPSNKTKSSEGKGIKHTEDNLVKSYKKTKELDKAHEVLMSYIQTFADRPVLEIGVDFTNFDKLLTQQRTELLEEILKHNKDDMTGLYDYDGIAQEVIDLVKK